jgi:hypothetical protein
MYEVGTGLKNHVRTLMKNAIIPLVTVTFYFFGWWIAFERSSHWRFTSGALLCRQYELMDTHLGGPPVQGSPMTADDTADGHISMVSSGRLSHCCSHGPLHRSYLGCHRTHTLQRFLDSAY